MTLLTALGVAGIALLGGLTRGLTGFGTALVMAPLLMFLVSPETALAVISLVNLATAGQFLRQSWQAADREVLVPMTAAAVPAVPLGIWLLGWLDPHLSQRLIGLLVLLLCLLILLQPKALGAPTRRKSIGVGVLSGVLTGFGGIGGPPSVLYVLGTSHDADQARATFLVFFAALYPVAVVLAAMAGFIGLRELALAAAALPAFLLGGWAGGALYPVVARTRYRELVLFLLAAAGGAAVIG